MLFPDDESVRAVEADVRQWAALWPAGSSVPTGADAVGRALAVGIAAYDRVDALALRITDGIVASGGKVVYDLESARAIERLIKVWLAPTPRVVEQLVGVRRTGGTVERMDEYEARVTDAKLGISVSVERAAEEAGHFAESYPHPTVAPSKVGA